MSIKRIEIYTGEDGQTYYRGIAGNGEIVVPSEGYKRPQGAYGGVNLILSIPPDVEIIDLTGESPVILTAEQVREVVEADVDEVVELSGETAEVLE